MKKHLVQLAVVAGLAHLPLGTAMAQWQTADETLDVKQRRAAFDRINRQFSVLVTITNNGNDVMDMPLRLNIDNSTHVVTNAEQDGDISFISVDNDGLAPGESIRVPVYLAFAPKRLILDVSLVEDAGPGNNWTLVWQDEFNDSAIDTTKWDFEQNCWGGGNNEQQCYTDREENAYIEDGKLVIKAQREDFTGPDNPEGNPDSVTTLPYTSARLRTLNQGDWTYGRFEIRAKLPFGQGTWPAIWMLPSDYKYGTWAASGEIDIMEAVNLKTPSDDPAAQGAPENRVYGTLHFGRTWPGNVYVESDYHLPNDVNPADGFHNYAIEWEQGEIRWYVDGYHFATQTQDGWYTQYQDENGQWQTGVGDAPFNERFHLLLNLAVGGAWAANTNEKGIDESVFPQTMEVDYVRVYECSINPATGQGCATIGDNPDRPAGIEPPPLPGENSLAGNGPVFMLFDDMLNDALAVQSYNPEGTVSSYTEAVEGRGDVFTMEQVGNVGNVFFNADAPLDLQHFEQLGKLKFDLRVLSQAEGAELLVKVDSGWPAVGDVAIEINDDQWQQISLDVSALVEAGNRYAPGNTADLAQVLNPFVLEANGPMLIQVDNVRYEYDLAGKSEVVVYDENDQPPFAVGQYVASGSVQMEDVMSEDGAYGNVKQFSFNTNESVVYFQTTADNEGQTQKIDFSGFDTLSFDLKVVEDPRAEQNFFIKMDCGHPCSSGDYAIATPQTGIWTHYDIAIFDLIANTGSTLNLTQVDTPLVIFPAWGNQQGVVMQVDNIVISGEGSTSTPTPNVITITDSLTIFDDVMAQGWSLWDCCANADLSIVADNERGNVAQIDYFGPAPTVSGFRANIAHDATAIGSGVLSFAMKMVSAPDDASAELLLKVEGNDGSYAQVPVAMNLGGTTPQTGQWQQYSFSLADLAAQGLSLDKINLIMMFPEWNKATGAVLQIDDLTLSL